MKLRKSVRQSVAERDQNACMKHFVKLLLTRSQKSSVVIRQKNSMVSKETLTWLSIND